MLGPLDVFWGRVHKTATCWLWLGATDTFGYGQFLLPGEERISAHRFSYQLVHGPIPTGMIVMHSCDVPACINPDHLSVGTRGDNNRDATRKRRNAFGEKNGHARLTTAQVQSIRADPRSQAEIARAYGVTQSHISRIMSGDVWAKG